MKSPATSVTEYLRSLPPDRRKIVSAVRSVVRKNLPKGYREAMNWGAVNYEVPLARYPNTYNGHPLTYVALAAQKNYYAIYLMHAYQSSPAHKALVSGFQKAGKKLDMGKCCVRFRSLDDLPLDVIGQAVASTTPEAFIKTYEASRRK